MNKLSYHKEESAYDSMMERNHEKIENQKVRDLINSITDKGADLQAMLEELLKHDTVLNHDARMLVGAIEAWNESMAYWDNI